MAASSPTLDWLTLQFEERVLEEEYWNQLLKPRRRFLGAMFAFLGLSFASSGLFVLAHPDDQHRAHLYLPVVLIVAMLCISVGAFVLTKTSFGTSGRLVVLGAIVSLGVYVFAEMIVTESFRFESFVLFSVGAFVAGTTHIEATAIVSMVGIMYIISGRSMGYLQEALEVSNRASGSVWFDTIMLITVAFEAAVSYRIWHHFRLQWLLERERDHFLSEASVPVFGIDVEGRINFWNAQMEFVTGFSRDDVIDCSLSDCVVSSSAEASRRLRRMVHGPPESGLKIAMRTRTPPVATLFVSATKVRGDNGACTGLIVFASGQTASERKSDYAIGYINHELRNPLNGLVASLGNATSTFHRLQGRLENHGLSNLTTQAVEHLSTASTCTGIMQTVLDDILATHFFMGYFRLQIVETSIAEILHTVIHTGSLRIQKPQVKVRLEPSRELEMRMSCDRARLTQVLLNLVVNAIKFTDDGTVTVSVSSTPTTVTFEVNDTGCGMSQDRVDQVLALDMAEDFLVATQHNGLGLYLCCKLVRQMGGRLDVDSSLGKGTKVRVSFDTPLSMPTDVPTPVLPFMTSHPPDLPRALPSLPVPPPVPPVGKSQTVKSEESGDSEKTTPEHGAPTASSSDSGKMAFRPLPRPPILPNLKVKHMTFLTGPRSLSPLPEKPESPPRSSEASNSSIAPLPPLPGTMPSESSFSPARRPSGRLASDPYTALVVDDVALNRNVMRHILTSMRYSVIAAEDGLQAVTAATSKDNPVDVVFMDIQMPIMSGIQATERIRKVLVRRVPIIGVTANASKSDRDNCIRAGMDLVLAKPVLQRDLERALRPFGLIP